MISVRSDLGKLGPWQPRILVSAIAASAKPSYPIGGERHVWAGSTRTDHRRTRDWGHRDCRSGLLG